jgi:phage gp45-like
MDMNTISRVFAFAMCVVAAAAFAGDAHMGTWTLNEALSNIATGAPKNNTVVYAAAGDSVKITVDGVMDGKPTHNEWTGKFDGKPYPVTGSPTADTRTYTKVDEHTLTFQDMTTVTGRVVIAADGKSRTVTTSMTDAKGQKLNSTAVFDKQ